MLSTLSRHVMPRIQCKHCWWKLFSLFSWDAYVDQASLPCSRVLTAQAWLTWSFVCLDRVLFDCTLFQSFALTQSRALLSIRMEGRVSTSWPMTFVFLMLIVRANSLQAYESWSPDSLLDASAASSANNIYLRITLVTFVLDHKRARFKSLPSALVCR